MTDIIMPGADGLAVLRAARSANPDVKVVILTGYASLDTAIEAVRLGAADYLSKPFTLGQIEVMVRRLTQRLNLEQENRKLADHVRGRRSEDHVLGRLDTSVPDSSVSRVWSNSCPTTSFPITNRFIGS